jgi:hypothetical protein
MNRSIDLLEQLAEASADMFRMNRRGNLYLTGGQEKVPAIQEQASRI